MAAEDVVLHAALGSVHTNIMASVSFIVRIWIVWIVRDDCILHSLGLGQTNLILTTLKSFISSFTMKYPTLRFVDGKQFVKLRKRLPRDQDGH